MELITLCKIAECIRNIVLILKCSKFIYIRVDSLNNKDVKTSYSLAFGFCCLSMASATILRWTLPVAVFGILSVKKI